MSHTKERTDFEKGEIMSCACKYEHSHCEYRKNTFVSTPRTGKYE